jgi:hypothetical protein
VINRTEKQLSLGEFGSGFNEGGMSWMAETTIVVAWLIFLATYTFVAIGKIPVYRIDRAGAALLGGSLMVATGVM